MGRKVFIATAACGGVRAQLIQIRSRDEAREATSPSLLAAFGDALRVSVPLASKPGRWRPIKRQSADRCATDRLTCSFGHHLILHVSTIPPAEPASLTCTEPVLVGEDPGCIRRCPTWRAGGPTSPTPAPQCTCS